MENKALSYREFIELAQQNYTKGGSTFVECWEEYQFNDYVQLFGAITKQDAIKLFEVERQYAITWANGYSKIK